jgi:hypothetical protein
VHVCHALGSLEEFPWSCVKKDFVRDQEYHKFRSMTSLCGKLVALHNNGMRLVDIVEYRVFVVLGVGEHGI